MNKKRFALIAAVAAFGAALVGIVYKATHKTNGWVPEPSDDGPFAEYEDEEIASEYDNE